MNEEAIKIINSIKLLGIDMIDAAGSGHPGIVLGAAPIMYCLYANHLRIDPSNPKWFNRDRFIMSSGHGSALLYATLFMAGYDLTLEDLVRFRQIDSKTPGHPEMDKTPGVDFSTGALGNGFASAVGMAMAEKFLESSIGRSVKRQKLIDHKIYCFVSDGDLQEGISYEAANIAGLYRLNNLIVLYDSNDVTLDHSLNKSSKENIIKRFDACGWNTDFVKDGTNIKEIDKAINRAKRNRKAPTIIEIKTIIGKDSFNQGTNIVHGRPLSKDDIASLRQLYGLDTGKFELNAKLVEHFRSSIKTRMKKEIKDWNEYYDTFKKTSYEDVQTFVRFFETDNISLSFDAEKFRIQPNYCEELRDSNSKILNVISERTPFFLGGSADLGGSCKTNLLKSPEFDPTNYWGKNINFGVREHAMGAIINGIASYNLRPFASTFLVFADYLKADLRMAALNNLASTYIFTHDSISVGEDGPTHQPIEQLKMLRSIPNFNVYRPGDINEVIGCWDSIINSRKPCALVISKMKIHILKGTSTVDTSKGGYIVKKEDKKLDGVLICSGSELTTCLLVAEKLKKEYDLRVVSIPCQEIFVNQPSEYQESIIPKDSKKICVEASTKDNWVEFTDYDHVIGLDTFGASGKANDVLKKYHFDEASIEEKIKALLK